MTRPMKGIEGQLSLVELSHRALVRSVSRDDYFFFFFARTPALRHMSLSLARPGLPFLSTHIKEASQLHDRLSTAGTRKRSPDRLQPIAHGKVPSHYRALEQLQDHIQPL